MMCKMLSWGLLRRCHDLNWWQTSEVLSSKMVHEIHFHLLLFSFSLNRVGHFVCDSKNWMVIKTTRLLFCADIKKKNGVIPDTSVIPNKRFYHPRLTEAKQHNHCLNSYIMSNKNIPCNSIKQLLWSYQEKFSHLVAQNYFWENELGHIYDRMNLETFEKKIELQR